MTIKERIRFFLSPYVHQHEWSEWETKPAGSMRLGPLHGVRITNADPAVYRACKTCDLAEMRSAT